MDWELLTNICAEILMFLTWIPKFWSRKIEPFTSLAFLVSECPFFPLALPPLLWVLHIKNNKRNQQEKTLCQPDSFKEVFRWCSVLHLSSYNESKHFRESLKWKVDFVGEVPGSLWPACMVWLDASLHHPPLHPSGWCCREELRTRSTKAARCNLITKVFPLKTRK